MTIKDFIQKDKENLVWFYRFKNGFFYYTISKIQEKRNYNPPLYEFPIPVEDLGNGELKSGMRAIELMRWIRKAIEEGTMLEIERNIRVN